MRRLAPAAGLLALALAACGGGDDPGEEGATATVAAGGEVRVVGDEYSFDPEQVVVTGARRGSAARLEVTLANQGALAHNLKVLQGDRELGGTPTFPGGRTESGTVRLPPGRYEMVCTVGNHAELGMVGTLEVRAE